MKFKYYLQTIVGVDIYPLISLMIFVLFFIAVGIFVFRLKKDYVDSMSRIPLGEDISGDATDERSEK